MHIRYNESIDLWEYLTNPITDTWSTLPIDAAQITSGALANYARTNIANTFSATGNIFSEILRADKGIKFPATQIADTDVNTLDDYEEGSWTPVIGGSGGQTGQTYSIQVGFYEKIGKKVHCSFYVVLSAKGTVTSGIQLKGLPFAIANRTNYYPAFAVSWQGTVTGYVFMAFQLRSNESVADLLAITAAATGMAIPATANIGNTTGFQGIFSYEASA